MTETPTFTAWDWFEVRGRGWAVSIRGIPGFNPDDLLGQRVLVDGTEYTVKGVETGLLLDNSGEPFGLLVGER